MLGRTLRQLVTQVNQENRDSGQFGRILVGPGDASAVNVLNNGIGSRR